MNLLPRFLSSFVGLLSLSPLLAPLATADPLAPSPSRALAEELGSLRNARVAIEMPEPKIELTYFAGSISASEQEELTRLAPNVRIVTGLSQKEALKRAEEAHGIDARFANPEFLKKASNLRWVQVQSAGVDRYLSLKPLMENDKLVLTNFRGIHGPAIALSLIHI